MVACIYVIIVILQALVVSFVSAAQSPAILSVRNVIPGATATFECSLPSVANPNTLNIYKGNALVYTCITIAYTCSKTSSDTDYSFVTFTALGTESAKGTFTVANADQTRDGGEWTCIYGTSLISSPDTFVVSVPGPATLSVTNVLQGVTATFECSYPNLESPTSLHIHKGIEALYQCTDIASTCSSSDNDYSDVTFTDLDTASAKGTFTVANADQTEDGGHWTCKYGTSLKSPPVNFIVTDKLSWCISNICSCIGVIVGVISGVIIAGVNAVCCWCCRHHIRGKTIEKVTHDTIQLRWRMVGLDPKGLGVKAICGEQHHTVDPNDKGTYTVTFENLTPDTSYTIYLEFTDKKRKHCREKLIQIQTLKASTSKPKGLPSLKTNRVHAAYAPRPGHDGEETHNRTSSPDSNFTGIP